jgi:hypothetical protein
VNRHDCIHSSDYRTIHTFLDLLRFDSLILFDLEKDTVLYKYSKKMKWYMYKQKRIDWGI